MSKDLAFVKIAWKIKKLIFSAIKSQFSYWSLEWMFCSRQTNNMISCIKVTLRHFLTKTVTYLIIIGIFNAYITTIERKGRLIKIYLQSSKGFFMTFPVLIKMNDLHSVSSISEPITFGNNAKVFCLDKGIKNLFKMASVKLRKSVW